MYCKNSSGNNNYKLLDCFTEIFFYTIIFFVFCFLFLFFYHLFFCYRDLHLVHTIDKPIYACQCTTALHLSDPSNQCSSTARYHADTLKKVCYWLPVPSSFLLYLFSYFLFFYCFYLILLLFFLFFKNSKIAKTH